PRGNRRIRFRVPDRGRRRGRVLAAPRPRRGDRIRAGRRRLAPPPPLHPPVLEAAGRIRQSGSPVGAQMAREVQPVRAVELGRTPLRKRAVPRLLVREGTCLPGRLGHGAVPIPLRVPRFPMVRGSGAGVVPAHRAPLGDVPPEPRLGRRPPPRTRSALRDRDTAGAGRDQRASCPFRRPRSQASRFAPRTANRRLVPPSHATDGPADGTPAGRAHAVAETRPENATPVPSPSDDLLARSTGAAGGHLATGSAGSPGEGGGRPGRRRVRPVGPRGPRWAPRPEP